MGRKKDRFWEYAEELKDGFKCHFCQHEFSGGISRIKSHLSKVTGRDISVCTDVSEEVQREACTAIGVPNKKVKGVPSTSNFGKNKTISASSSSPSNTLSHDKDKSAVDKLLAQHVVLNNLPIDVVQSSSFKHFVQGVAEYGPDYRLPSDSSLKTKLIPDLRMEVEDYIRKVKKSWVTTGCTLMLDLWGDKKQGDFISIIAYSRVGAVFMKLFEIPNERKELNLANIVSSVIEEIGPDHVIQFITNDRKFDKVGVELVNKYPRMYTTRCAAHGVHILLKDIYKEVVWVKKVIDDANSVVEYMYKSTIISSLMREHTNKELKRPCMTRFASKFLMLQSIFEVQNELWSLVTSFKWRELDCHEEDMAKRVTSIIESTEFWSQGQEVLEILKPLVPVLQLAETNVSTSGYLYEAMERAKGVIKQLCENNQAKYKRVWELLEERHLKNMILPIHAAAAFLNPAYMCSNNFREDDKMKEGINLILERLVADKDKEAFTREMHSYRMKVPSLFTTIMKTTLKTSHPCIWWDYCRQSLPVLCNFAIRILSQPCSFPSCEQNWSTFEAVQTKNKYRLATKTLNNIVYVRMNAMMMKKSYMMEAEGLKPIDLTHLSELPDYADHEQGWEDYALDASDEDLDEDIMNEVYEYAEYVNNYDDDDAFDATDKDIHGDDPSCLEGHPAEDMSDRPPAILAANSSSNGQQQQQQQHAEVESPVSAYLRYLQNSISTVDPNPKHNSQDFHH